MNIILGFSQLLLHNSTLSPSQRDQLTTIVNSGEHLMKIINDILEMSRVESGRVTINSTNFDLRLMLNNLEHMFSQRAQAKNLRFSIERQGDFPHCVLADETKLSQILINLIGNAMKYTPSEGTIIVRIKSSLETDGLIRLDAQIEDTGPGIAPEDMTHLFEAFFQAGAGKRVPGGTGLGLAISREFVRLMGGEIDVKSQVGIGTTFRFFIRVALGKLSDSLMASEPIRQVLHLQPGLPECRILVVDDQEEIRSLLDQLLAPVGFKIRGAADGIEALAQCKIWSPTLGGVGFTNACDGWL